MSSNHVVSDERFSSQPGVEINANRRLNGVSKRNAYITVSVLCFVNLLNYMDRFTVAGIALINKTILIMIRQSFWVSVLFALALALQDSLTAS